MTPHGAEKIVAGSASGPILDSCPYPLFALLPSNGRSLGVCGCEAASSVRRETEVTGSKVTDTEDSRRSGDQHGNGNGWNQSAFMENFAYPAFGRQCRRAELAFSQVLQGLVCTVTRPG